MVVRLPMQQVLILFLFFVTSVSANEDCKMRSASSLASEHDVGPVTDLVKDKSEEGKCTVTYGIVIDGEHHVVSGSFSGLEQQESLCRLAIENSRKNLLVELGGTFITDAVTVCDDNETDLVDNVRIGDTILENEVGPSKITGYFNYQNTKCRMFTQRLAYRQQLKVYNGVICQVDNSKTNWIVVDKW